jgi:ATP-dependent helicase/nuclease subunit B
LQEDIVSETRPLFCGRFSALEDGLRAQVQALREQSRLAPLAVIVPNELLREHLSRAFVDHGLSHANIHFLTLHRLAARLAESRLRHDGTELEPNFADRLALARIMERGARQLRYFRGMVGKDGFCEALLATLRDLREAGLGPKDLAALRENLGESRAAWSLGMKLDDLLMLWYEVDADRKENHYCSESEIMEIAAEEAGQSAWLKGLAHVMVYGYYDFNGAQKRLLDACFGVTTPTIYFPFEDRPAFDYARPALEWLGSAGFMRKDLASTISAPAALARVQGGLFSASEKMDDDSGHDGLCVISAPGDAREADAVAAEVLHSDQTRIGILLRAPNATGELLHDALNGAGVSGAFRESLSLATTPAGKALLLFANLIDSPLRRADVMDFLSVAPLRPLLPFMRSSENPPVAFWNHLTIQAGIVEGRQEWVRRLDLLAESGDLDDSDATRDGLHTLDEIIKGLLGCLDNMIRKKSWRAWADGVSGFFREHLRPDDEFKEILRVVGSLASLDTTGVPPSGERFRTFLRDSLARASRRVGRFQQQEPLVSPLMKARGVPFDTVILTGMTEKCFPRPSRQDPVLLDGERRLLNEALVASGKDGDIPIKGRQRDEERLLFTLAVQAASCRLVLTWPRMDSRTARPRIPSFYLLRVMEALTGEPCDFERLETAVRRQPIGKFVRMSRLDEAGGGGAVSALEYDLAILDKARKADAPRMLAYLAEESPFFGRALAAEAARFGTTEFTPYDGIIQDGALLNSVATRLINDKAAVSPTRLEAYASCPFSYLMRFVYGLDAIDEPEHVPQISPLDRGSLIHDILWEFMTKVVADESLPLRTEHGDVLERIALNRLTRFERSQVIGYPLTWLIERRRILSDLAGFLQREADEAAAGSPYAPSYFEVRFGMRRRKGQSEESGFSQDRPAELKLKDGRSMRFRGRIDRIDVDAKGKKSRVIDYKTGGVNKKGDGCLHGGTALQLPIYLLAASQLLKGFKADYAAYDYCTSKGGYQRVRFDSGHWKEKVDSFKWIVSTILDGIKGGRFYRVPDMNLCRFCDAKPFCGSSAMTEIKWQCDNTHVTDHKTMMEIE